MATQLTLNDGSLNSAGALAIKTNGTTQAINITTGQQVEFNDGSASAPSITNTGDGNTGIFFPDADTVGITTGGTERLRVDSAGNLGLGVTPSAWSSSYKTLQFTGGSISSPAFYTLVTTGAYYNGTNWIYTANDNATQYYQNSGFHIWRTAASGTAGNAITFTQAMTLDASGQLGIGTTSPASILDVNSAAARVVDITSSSSNGAYLRLKNTSTTLGYLGSAKAIFGSTLADLALDVAGANNLIFGTNDTERARIDSSGNLLVGQTSTGAQNLNSFAIQVSTASIVQNHINGTGSGSGYTSFAYNAGVIGSITQNGTTAVAYNTTSDYRLKENVQPLSGALARVAAMKPCTYTWKSAPDEIGEGFIAHELQEVCPQAVTGEKDAVNEDGSIKPQSIDTSFLVATLTAAIQELKAEFDAYKASHP